MARRLRFSNPFSLSIPAMDMSGTPQTEEAPETQREKSRDSTFLSAVIVFEDSPQPHTVRIRNISSGGMMIDVSQAREKGLGVTAELKNIGEVRGRVAWSTASRMGIAFDQEIDPLVARHKPTAAPATGFKLPYTGSRRPGLAIR